MSTHTTAFHCSSGYHLVRLGKYAMPIHEKMLQIDEHKGDGFFGSKPALAHFFNLKKDNAIRTTIQEMVEEGWAEIIRTDDGRPINYRAITHKEWAEKHPGRCCVKGEFGEWRKHPVKEVSFSGTTPPQSRDSLKEGLPISEGDPSLFQGVPLPVLGGAPSLFQGPKSPSVVPELVAEKVSDCSSGSKPSAIPDKLALDSEKPAVIPSFFGKRKPTTKPWVCEIWQGKRSDTATLIVSPTDAKNLERLIAETDEPTMILAWHYYVTDENLEGDPVHYTLEPVVHVDQWTSKKGNKCSTVQASTAEITRRPFRAFLSEKVVGSFIDRASAFLENARKPYVARDYIESSKTWRERPGTFAEHFRCNMKLPQGAMRVVLGQHEANRNGLAV
jgi:hypothetical protein